MNIKEAKQQVKDTVMAYLLTDEVGAYKIPIAKQRPLFLLGAPGIGKTAIMAQVAQEMGIGLVSYSMTHHTRQSALGLPRIVHHTFGDIEYDASEYTMSEIVAALYDYMKRTGLDRGILFLDEINCVSETLYPSMLQFLQFKTFGQHRIPDGWVIVCAGNPPAYNRSVHEFDIVTMDRLRKIVIEPDLTTWNEYALNNDIHPAISSYLQIKSDNFYAVESTPEGKAFVTARGWEDLSEVIKAFDEMEIPVDINLIEQFLQKAEIAEDFALYYELFNKYRSDYQIESILDGTVSDQIKQRARAAEFDERLALLGLILDKLTSNCKEVLAKEAVVSEVRTMLKEIKDALIAGASLDETLRPLINTQENALKIASEAHTLSPQAFHDMRKTIAQLKKFDHICALQDIQEGKAAFDTIHYTYRGLVGDLEQSVKRLQRSFDNAFAFVDAVFNNEQEGLIFVTELTSRQVTSRFIAKFSSMSYYQHNDGLMLDEYHDALVIKIDELLNDDEPSHNSSLDTNELAHYYDGAQLEYGFASLCKMTLPDNLAEKRILDIGSRRGKGVFKLSSCVGDEGFVLGLDWVPDYISESKARMEQAWQKSGLTANNMDFKLGYPEDLRTIGVEDESFDIVFINSIINLTYDPDKVLNEIYRVLKPGGTAILETTYADAHRENDTVQKARELGNSIQASPYKDDLIERLKNTGFHELFYFDEHEVKPANGALPDKPVPVVDSSENVSFKAGVIHAIK